MKIVSIVGARPQFIKAAAVSRPLRAEPGFREVLIHTGQHYDENMSEVFFRELDIPRPDHQLDIGSGFHGQQTGRMIEAIEKVLLKEGPDRVLVYGDTNTTLAGTLAAVKLHIPVAHVEAGLRSFNRRMPEEINRVLTDHASDILFAPTRAAVANLTREGIPAPWIRLVGDVMYDAALNYSVRAERESRVLDRLSLRPKSYVLATVHRAENTDDPERLDAILGGLDRVAGRVPVVLPLHPRLRAVLLRRGDPWVPGGLLTFIDAVSYLEMIVLEKNSLLIATDSGGVQKEAFFFRVPCVTLRDETEWVELVELGYNRVLPPRGAEEVAEGIAACLDSRAMAGPVEDLYGGGRAAAAIVAALGGE